MDERLENYARGNVARNNLESRITVMLNKSEKKLPIDGNVQAGKNYAFCMCNPPFYESEEEQQEAKEMKIFAPSAVCTGSSPEMVTPGGEFQFVKSILDESLSLCEQVTWYTSMVGKKETMSKIVAELKANKIDNYAVTEFVQGHTRRWGVGWSFGLKRARMNVAQPTSKKLKKQAPPISEFRTEWPADVSEIRLFLSQLFGDLEVHTEWKEDASAYRGRAFSNTWSRAARRQRARAMAASSTASPPRSFDTSDFLFDFTCSVEAPVANGSRARVTMSWTAGKDRTVFEGFYLHVKKRLEQRFNGDASGVPREAE